MEYLKKNWYQIFKYTVYTALFFNILFFLIDELGAFSHRFEGNFEWLDFIDAFTATIDTAAWVVLLILFELETYVIDDKKLKGWLGTLFRFIRGFCYIFIIYSLWGYMASYTWLQNFDIIDQTEICQLNGHSWLIYVDEYETINQDNCSSLAQDQTILKYQNQEIYTDQALLSTAIWLALTDVINSLAWILIVIVLEIDLWLQLRNRFKGKVFTISKYVKNILYLTLLLAAIYWGLYGDFLDFWDAFLWIIAFVFIEMNLLEWKRETESKEVLQS